MVVDGVVGASVPPFRYTVDRGSGPFDIYCDQVTFGGTAASQACLLADSLWVQVTL
jgi:hypothetical protein